MGRLPPKPAGRGLSRVAAGLVAASALTLVAGCAERDDADTSTHDAVVARYQSWRSPGTIDAVTAGQLAGWRQLPRKGDARPAPLEDQLAALLRTLRLADETPQPLGAALAQRAREAEERVLEQALRTAVRAAAESPSPGESSALARTRPEAFRRPRLLRLRNLLVRVEPGASDSERSEARAHAEALHREIAGGADFGTVARRASDSETRTRDGRLGWVDPNRLAPGMRDAALALTPGEYSGVLASADGWVILACEGVRAADAPGRRGARAAAALRSRNERQAWGELRAELLAEAAADPALEHLSPPARIRTVAAARAREQGLDVTPSVANRLQWTRAQTLAADTLRRRAQEQAGPIDRDAVRAHYDAQHERWQTLPSTHLRAIRLPRSAPLADLGEALVRERAEALRAGLATGERLFPFAARDASDHPSRPRGGDLGWLGVAEVAALGPDVSRAVKGLAVGETSPVVPQDDGFWILRVEARDPGRGIAFEEVERTLEHQLREARVQEAAAAITRELRAELELELGADSPDAEDGPDGSLSTKAR